MQINKSNENTKHELELLLKYKLKPLQEKNEENEKPEPENNPNHLLKLTNSLLNLKPRNLTEKLEMPRNVETRKIKEEMMNRVFHL
jgi:hypothetical protein